MKRKTTKLPLGLFSLGLFSLYLLTSAFAFSASAQDISDFDSRLKKIKEEINLLQKKLQEEKQKETSLLSQLNQLSLEKKLLLTELNLNLAERQKIDKEVARLRGEINALRQKLAAQKQQMEKTLVSLYKYGRLNWVDFFLRADSLTSIIAENKRFELLVEHQNSILNEYLRTEANLSESTRQLETKRGELQKLYDQAEEKRQALENKERSLREFTLRVQRNKLLFEQTIKEYQERAEQLQALMDKIIKQEVTLPFRFVPFYEKKGKLPWPLTGRVITPFGLQRHPQFNTVTLNNGIEIAPVGQDRTVRTVHAGKVVYADNFQGYGDLVIVDHGLNYYSLYGHCAEFLINKGDWVQEGQPIAIAGDSGSLKGLCLYFEIRYKTKALDPLQWLRKK